MSEQQEIIEVAAEEIVESANPVSLVERVGEFVDSIVEELGEGRHELDADAVELLNMLQRCSVAVAGVYGIPCGGALLFPAPAMVAAGVVVEQQNGDDPAVAAKYKIQALPTWIMVAGGVEVSRTTGTMSSDQMVKWFQDTTVWKKGN